MTLVEKPSRLTIVNENEAMDASKENQSQQLKKEIGVGTNPSVMCRASPRAVIMKDLIGPIVTRGFFANLLIAISFACLGSTGALAPFETQARWLVDKLALIWPVLPAQYAIVYDVRGPGHAASFAFMCGALWVLPVICALAILRELFKREAEMLPVSSSEIGAFFLMAPLSAFPLMADMTKSRNPTYAFNPDQFGVFYIWQAFIFSIVLFVLSIFFYLLERAALKFFRK